MESGITMRLNLNALATLPAAIQRPNYDPTKLGIGIVHLGLGSATRIEKLVVRWPSGLVQDLGTIPSIDRTVTVDESKGSL